MLRDSLMEPIIDIDPTPTPTWAPVPRGNARHDWRTVDRALRGHLIDAAVAADAADAPVHMDRVIEVDEVRQRVHALPANRLAGGDAGAQWFDQLAVVPDLR